MFKENRIYRLLEEEGKPTFVSKMRSWVRALGIWREGVETRGNRNKEEKI